MKIHVPARSKAAALVFQKRHPHMDVEFHFETQSLFSLLSTIIHSNADYAIVCHDDVFLPVGFVSSAVALVERLNRTWPNWGLCGNAGILPFLVGGAATRTIRYVADPHGGINYQGTTFPAITIDGNTMLLNLRAMRSRGVTMPQLPGFQLYDAFLAVATISAGLAVLVAPELACYHSSSGSQIDFDRVRSDRVFGEAFGKVVANLSLPTLNGDVRVPFEAEGYFSKIDIYERSLAVACVGRPLPSVAILIRTQFKRKELLRRALQTATAFAAASAHVEVEIWVVTDSTEAAPSFVAQHAKILECPVTATGDNRALLLLAAIEAISSDYFWVLDDDDWLFPNSANIVGSIVNIASDRSIVFVGVSQFDEAAAEATPYDKPNKEIRYFPPTVWCTALNGINSIPINGQIISRTLLQYVDRELFARIVYFEDFALQLFAITQPRCNVYVLDQLCGGISIRRDGQSITAKDRTIWERSMAELAATFAQRNEMPGLFASAARAGALDRDGAGGVGRSLSSSESRLIKLYRTQKRVTQKIIDRFRRL